MNTNALEDVRAVLAIAANDLQRIERFVARMVGEGRDAAVIAGALRDELIDAKRLLNSVQIAASEIAMARDQLALPLQ